MLFVVGCNHNNGDVTVTTIATNASDPSLINAWGLAFNPMGFAWVSANGTGISEIYDDNGNHAIPSVAIPTPGSAFAGTVSTPTGQAFNADSSAFLGDAFIFGTEDGTISGWQSADGSAAALRIDNSATSVYKGVALGQASNGDPRLYAANFRNGTVDVFDGSYKPVPGGFIDQTVPAGFAPFNVSVIPGGVLVSYALQDQAKLDDVAGSGNGFVDEYDADGTLLGRLISRGELNSPWAMTLSPASFDAAESKLLVGNFGDGTIHFYNIDNTNHTVSLDGTFENNSTNAPLVIDGLWALEFGPGTGGFASNVLYFTAGPNMESDGVFGRLNSSD